MLCIYLSTFSSAPLRPPGANKLFKFSHGIPSAHSKNIVAFMTRGDEIKYVSMHGSPGACTRSSVAL